MIFKDYNGTTIELSTEVWENHIKVNHPEIDLSEIELTLKDPDVRFGLANTEETQNCFTNERKLLRQEKFDIG